MADDNAAIIAALKGLSPQDQAAMQPETFANPAVQNILGSIATLPQRAIENSQHSLDTGTYDPAVPVEAATSLAGVGVPMAEAGAAGIFGGKLAQTADLKALNEAERMRMGGVHPANVWADTGWVKSPMDSKWKFEIPDNKMALKYMPTSEGDKAIGSVDSLVSHPELKKAYPQLFDYRMQLSKDSNVPTGTGMFQGAHPIISDIVSPEVVTNAPNMSVGRSVAAHELQHGVQDLEGFAYGADPRNYAQVLENDVKNSDFGMKNYDFNKIKSYADDFYHRTAGEVEARNVQNRLDFAPLHRKMVTPWESQDVPFNQQLLVEALKGYK